MGNWQSAEAVSAGAAAQPRRDADVHLTPFQLTDVSLTSGSRLHTAAVANATYILSLDVDRLLFSFRVFAGVDTRGAAPYGGWESPSSGGRGHFVGQVLGAYAAASASLKATDPALASGCLKMANALVAGLAECQKATSSQPYGYLNAQSAAQFDRLEALQACDVPYYVIHKIMAGLLSAYRYTGSTDALTVVSAMGDYFSYRLSKLTAERIAAMINTRRYTGQNSAYYMEHGGMLDAAVELYRITGKAEHLSLLQSFDRAWFLSMLVNGQDALGQNAEHSNTELPVVVGLGNLYELGKDSKYRTAVLNFLGWMQSSHEFITGGVSGKSAYPQPLDYNSELFNSARLLDRQINSTPGHPGQASGESCCAHNLQKSTAYGLSWTGDARWGDEYEKRFVNSVLPQQNSATGMLLYNLNLKQASHKDFGDRENSFWCCYGTGVEAFAALSNAAFLQDGDSGLWVNNYVASSLSWAAQGLKLTLDSSFPDSGQSKLTFTMEQTRRLVVHVRIPYWAVKSVSLQLNGVELQVAKQPATFAVIDRQWQSGDVLSVDLPYSLYTETIPDKPEYVGVKYGPHALVACGPASSTFTGTAAELLAALTPLSSPPACCFSATLQGPIAPRTVVFKPISTVVDEYYNGYTIVSKPPAAVQLDAVDIADSASEAAHGLQSANSATGNYGGVKWRDASNNGFISYKLQVSSSRRTSLRCLYLGDDAGDENQARLFDLQVLKADGSYLTFATQSLDMEAPGAWYTVAYPIPLELTQGATALTFRWQAKGFNGKPGSAGGLMDQVQTFYLADEK